MIIYFLGLKIAFLLGLVKSFTQFDQLARHFYFIALLYVAGIAGLSWVFLMAPVQRTADQAWAIWLVKTFVIALVYFKLLDRFDEGSLFWIILVAGFLFLIYF